MLMVKVRLYEREVIELPTSSKWVKLAFIILTFCGGMTYSAMIEPIMKANIRKKKKQKHAQAVLTHMACGYTPLSMSCMFDI